jgi:tape measure domain-containing protein
MSEMARLIVEFMDKGGAELLKMFAQVQTASNATAKVVDDSAKKMEQSEARAARAAKKAADERARIALYEINEKNKFAKQDLEFFNAYLAQKDKREARAAQRSRQQAEATAKAKRKAIDDEVAGYEREARAAQRAAETTRRLRATQDKQLRDLSARTTGGSTAATSSTVSVGGLQGVGLSLGAVTNSLYLLRTAVAAVNAELDNAAKWEKYVVALTDIEGSAGIARRSMEQLYELAKRPGIGLEEAQQTYLQFRALGIEGDKATQMIKAFSNAVALSGGGALEFQRINYQLTQMLSKGKVLEEDLRIMRNSMPRLTVLMRDAFGATTAAGIREAGINAEQFVAGIVREMEKLPTATQTLQSRLENVSTAWSRLRASFVDTDAFGRTVEALTEVLEKITELPKNPITLTVKLVSEASSDLLQEAGLRDSDRLYMDSETISAMRQVSAQVEDTRWQRNRLNNVDARTKREADARKKLEEDKKRKDAEEKARKAKDAADKALRESPDAKAGAQHLQRGGQLMSVYKKQDEEAQSDLVAEASAEVDRMWASEKELDEARKRVIARREKEREELLQQQAEVRQANQTELEALQAKYAKENAIIATMEGEKAELLKRSHQRQNRETIDFWAAQSSLVGTGGEGLFGAMADMMKNMEGEQARSYKVMFAVSKGFAIADASVQLAAAAIKALNTPWPASIGAVGTVMAAGGTLIGQINSTAYSGVFDKGGNLGRGEWGIAGENGPEIIEGPARITSTRDTARKLGSAPTINVYNYAGAQVKTKQNGDGSIDVMIREAVNASVNELTASVATGRGDFSRALQTTFGLKRGG